MSVALEPRRTLLLTVGAAGASAMLAACVGHAPGSGGKDDVSPVEDLMREHGVLRRVMLVYREMIGRLERREAFPPDLLASANGIIRSFVENYHETLEEDFVFPRFEKAHKQVELCAVLRQQHQAGRRVTDAIRELSTATSLESSAERPRLVSSLRLFVRMYEPHAAREDTVLLPELRSLMSDKDYDVLGDAFEEKEHKLFGPKGFQGVVAEVAQLEAALGMSDLASFTPS